MNFEYKRIINYYETDKMGIVHHSNYIRFLEEARCRWLEQLGISMEKLEQEGYTIPTLEVNCKYKYHVTSGDIIIIKPKITEYNGVRMTVSYDVIDEKTNKIVIDAWTKHCFTNKELRPINMKKKNEYINKVFEDILE
ncbi:MAG: acyl-CoA thioesterase [Clostridia bacterium]|nr:acyl-CoA thioesterase [Clostridia bacterium]